MVRGGRVLKVERTARAKALRTAWQVGRVSEQAVVFALLDSV